MATTAGEETSTSPPTEDVSGVQDEANTAAADEYIHGQQIVDEGLKRELDEEELAAAAAVAPVEVTAADAEQQDVEEKADDDETEIETDLAWKPPGESYFDGDGEMNEEGGDSNKNGGDDEQEDDGSKEDEKIADKNEEPVVENLELSLGQDDQKEHPVSEDDAAAPVEVVAEEESRQEEGDPNIPTPAAEINTTDVDEEGNGDENDNVPEPEKQDDEQHRPLPLGNSDIPKKDDEVEQAVPQLDTTMETTLSSSPSDEDNELSLAAPAEAIEQGQDGPATSGGDVTVAIDELPTSNLIVETPIRKGGENNVDAPDDDDSKKEVKGSPTGIMDAEALFQEEIDNSKDARVEISPQDTVPLQDMTPVKVEESVHVVSADEVSVSESSKSTALEVTLPTPLKEPKKKLDMDKGHVLGSEDSNLLLNKSTLRNAYRIFVLLLRPKVQKFELIQFLCSHNLPTITVRNILDRIPTFSAEQVFKEQEYAGLYRPETTQEELLNLDEVLVRREAHTGEFASTKILKGEILVAMPTGFKLKKIVRLVEKIMVSPAFKLLRGNNSIQAANVDARNELEQIRQQGLAKSRAELFTKKVEASEQDKRAQEEESRDLEQRRSRKSEFKFQPDRNGVSPLDAMYLSQNQQKSERQKTEQQIKLQSQSHSDTNWAPPVSSPVVTRMSVQARAVVTPDVQVPAVTAQNEPNVFQPKQATEQEVEVPGSSSNKARLSAKRQSELDALRQHSVTKAVNKVFNEKIEQSERDQKAREEEARDLEQRRANKKNYTFSPDSIGVSPLDALYMSQNQQKSERIKKEQETKLQNQRHSDHNVNKWSGSIASPPTSPTFRQKQAVSVDVVATEARLSITNKQDELEILRQQGVAQAANKSLSESAANKSVPRSNASNIEELEALREQGAAKAVTKIFNENAASSDHQSSWNHAELKESQQQSVPTPLIADVKSTPVPETQSELEQLRQLSLTKELNKQYNETVMANQKETEAHLAQQRDLNERKAKTSEFVPSLNSDLSATDTSRLSYTKWKTEDRQKDREALGYYRDWRSTDNMAPPPGQEEWITIGKALTTEGDKMTTRTWNAPDPDGKREEAPATNVVTLERHHDEKASNTVDERKANQTVPPGTASSEPVDQGCACVIL